MWVVGPTHLYYFDITFFINTSHLSRVSLIYKLMESGKPGICSANIEEVTEEGVVGRLQIHSLSFFSLQIA